MIKSSWLLEPTIFFIPVSPFSAYWRWVAFKRLIVSSTRFQGVVQLEPYFLEWQLCRLLKVADKPLLLFVFLDLYFERPDHSNRVLLDGRHYHLAGFGEGIVQVTHHVLYLPIRPGLVLELESKGHPLPVHIRLEVAIRGSAAMIARARPASPPSSFVQSSGKEPGLHQRGYSRAHFKITHPKDFPQIGIGLKSDPDLLNLEVMFPFIGVYLDGVFRASYQYPVHGVQGADSPCRQEVIGVGSLGGFLRVQKPFFALGIFVEKITSVPVSLLGIKLLAEQFRDGELIGMNPNQMSDFVFRHFEVIFHVGVSPSPFLSVVPSSASGGVAGPFSLK